MDMQNFLIEIDKKGYGVEFNTYKISKVKMFYIKISEFGDEGKFIKKEDVIENLNEVLTTIYLKVCIKSKEE